MRVIIQRVKSAECIIRDKTVSSIKAGLLLFSCFEAHDNEETISKAIAKIINLRIFEDDQGKMNLNVIQIGGKILNISQFTLSWRGEKGHRPSFENSMNPQLAALYYRMMCDQLNQNVETEKGEFGAEMEIKLSNDGPVSFILDF